MRFLLATLDAESCRRRFSRLIPTEARLRSRPKSVTWHSSDASFRPCGQGTRPLVLDAPDFERYEKNTAVNDRPSSVSARPAAASRKLKSSDGSRSTVRPAAPTSSSWTRKDASDAGRSFADVEALLRMQFRLGNSRALSDRVPSRTYADQRGNNRRPNRNVPQTRNRWGLSPGTSRGREFVPDT